MRAVFFGTPDVAATALRAVLDSSHIVAGVVTQPDRARGRGRSVSASPVKQIAVERGIPVLQPESPKEPGFAEQLRALTPDVLAVVAYGHILPPDVLAVAPAMNVHFSLLPRYRGAAPVQRAVMDGAKETGISVFMLEPTVDTGPVLLRERVSIGPEDTAGDLFESLAPLGARLLVRALDDLEAGALEPQPQDDTVASPAPKIKPHETQIDWPAPARAIVDAVRGLNPRPGMHSVFRGKRLMVWRARADRGVEGDPGTIVAIAPDGMVVACAGGAVALLEVQPEGKQRMSGADFVRGYRPEPGERLG